jgi:Ser/Thr protein kinase RdoA (MazF antagonist)
MRILNARPLIEKIFRTEAGLPDSVEEVSLVHLHDAQGEARWHGSKEVYRVRAGGRAYMAHVTPDRCEELRRFRDNLRFLAKLGDDRVPRVVAWRDSAARSAARAWAVMVCPELPGSEIGPSNYSPPAWADLCDLMVKVHSLSPDGELLGDHDGANHAEAFADFAECLLTRLEGLPLRSTRVRAHLAEMAAYVRDNMPDFRVTPRVIHGDLTRANLLLSGDRAAVIDWIEMSAGDYLYDLATLKYSMDSVVPRESAELLREQASAYRRRFADDGLELRMKFFLALPGLVHAYEYAGQTALFPAARAWRVRTCYLHSEAQWKSPLRLDGVPSGAPAARTPHWPDQMPSQVRGLYYLVAPKRVG